MDDDRHRAGVTGCPHVDRDDQRCSSRFNLGRIQQAFTVCFGSYHGCPMFHRINTELTRDRHDVTVTVLGHALDVPLRATGT